MDLPVPKLRVSGINLLIDLSIYNERRISFFYFHSMERRIAGQWNAHPSTVLIQFVHRAIVVQDVPMMIRVVLTKLNRLGRL